jgi:hypothetical protein
MKAPQGRGLCLGLPLSRLPVPVGINARRAQVNGPSGSCWGPVILTLELWG